MADDSSIQRISRLTPLGDVLARVEGGVRAVTPVTRPLAAAVGATLAENVVAAALPTRPIALRDGFAIASGTVADAGPYAPMPFAVLPPRVEAGDVLPEGADAILPLDAIAPRGSGADVISAVPPGEGVLPAGSDSKPDNPLCRAGTRLRPLDIAVLAAAGMSAVTIRAPRFQIACGSSVLTRHIEASMAMLRGIVIRAGGVLLDSREGLGAALADERADAIIAIGGTGSGRNDHSVKTLARLGRVEAHGIAVSPGDTAAFGFAATRPVLLAPGRLDAVLAIWLLIGRVILAKLAGTADELAPRVLPLKRKVASAIGLTEVIPVACTAGVAEPLASGYLSLHSLARSDGWIVVPADSEGYAAGTPVAAREWP